MPENDFEKQVQQKMDELQLRPSAVVWEEVEKRIRKEKKRRRFIFWIFLIGALLLGSAGWLLVNDNKKSITNSTSVEQTGNDKKTDRQTSVTDNATSSNISSANTTIKQEQQDSLTQPSNNIVIEKRNLITDKTSSSATIENASKVKQKKQQKNTTPSFLKEKEIAATVMITDNADKPVAPIQPKPIDGSSKDVVVGNTNTPNNDTIVADKQVAISNTNDKIATPVVTKEDSAIATANEPVPQKDSSKTKKNKWEIGITGFAGSSANTEGVSILGAKKSAQRYSQSSVTGPVALPPSVSYPSKGFSWQLGMYAKRKLSDKTGLSVGFNFSSYSTKQPTGVYVDSLGVLYTGLYSSSFDNFYRRGATRTYKNKYYYLEMPVSFHWQLNTSKKLPIVFQNGFAVGLLTGSDALAYSQTFSGFYNDSKSLTKIQFSYQTGLYVKLLNRTKNPLTVGILYSYHFNKLQKVNSIGGNHLSSFGVQLGWLLKK